MFRKSRLGRNIFSAGFGIPENQKSFLVKGHKAISKPTAEDHPQVQWLIAKIEATEEVRRQRRRQLSHQQRSAHVSGVRREIITELWHDSSGTESALTYNEVLSAAAYQGMPVRDIVEAGVDESSVDILFSVHDASKILDNNIGDHQRVLEACRRRAENARLTVGISPLGERGAQALAILNNWLSHNRPTKHLFIESAADKDALREVIWRWLHSIVGRRDPSRARQFRTLADQIFDVDTPLEDYYGKGAYL
jgi:hypothetical protein